MPKKKPVKPEEINKTNIAEILGNTQTDENAIIKLPLTENLQKKETIEIINDPIGYNSNNLENCSEIIQNKDKNKSLCLWCRYIFTDTSRSMPISYNPIKNHYMLYGTFCSFECVSAYNFSKNTRSDKVWDINNMINMLAKSYGFMVPIRPAPPYELLDIFGGLMDIETFREVHKSKDKFYTLNIPPQSYVTSVAEILNTSYISNKKKSKNVIEKMI